MRNEIFLLLRALCLRYKKTIVRQYTIVRLSFDVSGHARPRNFSSVMLKMNNDQEKSVSSAIYKYDTSTYTVFFLNSPDYREGYQCW